MLNLVSGGASGFLLVLRHGNGGAPLRDAAIQRCRHRTELRGKFQYSITKGQKSEGITMPETSPGDPLADPPRQHEATSNTPINPEAWQESFVSLLTAEQANLHRYILTLLGNYDAASNVLQETNLVLWRKVDQFESGTSFSAWSRKIAYWQTLAYLRDRKRDKHVFSEELVRQLSARSVLEIDVSETRIALRHCLAELTSRHRNLIKERYGKNLSIGDMAKKLGDQPSAVKVRLHRIRRALQQCIEKQMAATP